MTLGVRGQPSQAVQLIQDEINEDKMQSIFSHATMALKLLFGQLFLLMSVLLVLDFLAYFLTPNWIAWQFHHYRRADTYIGKPPSYPQGYYENHVDRGFDVGAKREAVHHLPEINYPIHSNAMGCFDRQWAEVPETYVYFAGDSFTWGFTSFGDRFEDITSIASLKCGVSSTSTLHQLDKFLELAERVGDLRGTVTLTFFENDVVGDYLYPNNAVMDGWLVHTRYFDSDGAPIEVDSQWVEDKLHAALKEQPLAESCDSSISILLQCYSLSANILNRIRHTLTGPGKGASEHSVRSIDYRGQKIYHNDPTSQRSPSTQVFPYLDQGCAKRNQKALRTWRLHASEHGYNLVVVLLPPPHVLSFDGAYYQEVVGFLEKQGIETINLLPEFRQRELQRHQLYWRCDGHLSPAGHSVVGDILIDWYGAAR